MVARLRPMSKISKSRWSKGGGREGKEGIRKHLEFIRKQPRYGAAGKVGRMKIARTFKSASPCDLTSMGHFSFPSFLFLSVGCARLLFLGRSPLLSLSLSSLPCVFFLFAGRVATFKLGVVGELLEKSFARFGLERASERAPGASFVPVLFFFGAVGFLLDGLSPSIPHDAFAPRDVSSLFP